MRVSRQSAIYWALLAASFAVALTVSWTSFGAQIDNDAYDWMFRLYQPPAWTTESILLAIDEPSLNAYGGVPGLRKPLAQALELISAASPKTVAVDLILADNTDPAIDARLEEALRATRNLVPVSYTHLLASNETAVRDGKRLPVRHLLVYGAEPQQFIFDQERHNLRELHLLFLAVRETGDVFSFHQRSALVDNVAKHPGRMAHQCDWLAGIVEGLQKGDRRRALREIPHRAVPTGIENGVEVFRLRVRKFDRVGESLLRRSVLLEPVSYTHLDVYKRQTRTSVSV